MTARRRCLSKLYIATTRETKREISSLEIWNSIGDDVERRLDSFAKALEQNKKKKQKRPDIAFLYED